MQTPKEGGRGGGGQDPKKKRKGHVSPFHADTHRPRFPLLPKKTPRSGGMGSKALGFFGGVAVAAEMDLYELRGGEKGFIRIE